MKKTLLTAIICAILFGLSGYYLGKNPITFTAITKIGKSTSVKDKEFDLQNYLNQFPETREGFNRYIIPAPKKVPGTTKIVDIVVGKNRIADCNSNTLDSVKTELKSEWTGSSYRYYYYEIEVGEEGAGMTTLIGCPSSLKFDVMHHPDIPKKVSFPLWSNDYYLPIVVDINANLEIGYVFWSPEEFHLSDQIH